MATQKQSILKRLTVYMGDKKWLFYVAMVTSALSATLTFLPVLFIWLIVRELFTKGVEADMALITPYGIYAAASAGAALICYFMALMASHLAAFKVEFTLKKTSFERVMKKPLGFFQAHASGEIRNIISDGAAKTHTFLAHQLPDFAGTLISPVIILTLLLAFDWRLGLACLIPLLLGFVILAAMMTIEGKDFQKAYFEQLENMSSEAVEYVRGIPVVKTFGQSVRAFTRFYGSILHYKKTVLHYTLLWTNPYSFYGAIVEAAAFFIVPAAILIISHGDETALVLSDFILYLLITPSIAVLFMRTMAFGQQANLAELALDKFDELLAYEDMTFGTETKPIDAGTLQFNDVTFRYPEANFNAVDGVSFQLKRGQTLALVGPSGGGKTTIARLCVRFWDAASGTIAFEGRPITDYTQETLMQRAAFVFQNNELFKKSLRENILIGNPDATEEQLQQAIESAQATEIIDSLPDGLDTIYGTKGTYLSGGEKQRIALARAILKDAPIVILDEATAFADPENEHLIYKALNKLRHNKTTIMIAHRLTTIQNADAIAVVDKGKITEMGTHAELIAANGLYKKMWDNYNAAADWKISRQNQALATETFASEGGASC